MGFVCFRFVVFYGKSILVGYLIPHPIYVCVYVCMRFVCFRFVVFYGKSILVGYLIPHPIYVCACVCVSVWDLFSVVLLSFMANQYLLAI